MFLFLICFFSFTVSCLLFLVYCFLFTVFYLLFLIYCFLFTFSCLLFLIYCFLYFRLHYISEILIYFKRSFYVFFFTSDNLIYEKIGKSCNTYLFFASWFFFCFLSVFNFFCFDSTNFNFFFQFFLHFFSLS